MTVFYSTLVSTFILALFSRFIEKRYKEMSMIFVFAIIIIFVLVAGLRANIGDTEAYIQGYYSLSNFTGFTDEMKDKGFTYFQLLLYNINSDPQFMIFITSLITQVCIILGLYKYRSYIELEIYMYITCGIFLVTMNGIRQAMVGAILFLCTKLVIDGRFIPYTIIVAILSTVHSSAIIMIPIYFVVRQKSWSKNTLIIIILAILAFIFFYELMPHFFDMLGDSSYKEYELLMSEEGIGSSFTRVLVNAVPVVLAYIYRDRIEDKWSNSNIFVNMSIINLIFITFALYNWIFARFQLYFQFYNIVLLPYIIKNCFENDKDKRLIYYLFMLLYFGFFYYEQVICGNGSEYMSNFIKF